MFVRDDWQLEVLKVKDENLIILGGRQIGKSDIVAELEGNYLMENPKVHLLIVSGVERQASGLYNKIIAYIDRKDPKALIKKGKDKVLKTIAKLKNGSIIRTEPLGESGSGARQHTLNRIVFEEMQLIPEDAFSALTPMLLTTGGKIHLLGTAWATEGYVYERLSDPDFKVFRIDAEEVAEKRPEPLRSIMLKHLENERKRLSEAQYLQEYKAIPSDKLRQIFPDSLIKKCQVLERTSITQSNYSFGVDPAGLGSDEGAISVVERKDNKSKIKQREFIITRKMMTNEMVDKILFLEKQYKPKTIYVDDGGVGFGVFSGLMNETSTRSKTIALNNASRPLDSDDKKRKRILKEDLYINLLRLMEKGDIELLKDTEIRESLKSCKFEYEEGSGKLKISSTYNHPTESLIRACWFANTKSLNLWVRWS